MYELFGFVCACFSCVESCSVPLDYGRLPLVMRLPLWCWNQQHLMNRWTVLGGNPQPMHSESGQPPTTDGTARPRSQRQTFDRQWEPCWTSASGGPQQRGYRTPAPSPLATSRTTHGTEWSVAVRDESESHARGSCLWLLRWLLQGAQRIVCLPRVFVLSGVWDVVPSSLRLWHLLRIPALLLRARRAHLALQVLRFFTCSSPCLSLSFSLSFYSSFSWSVYRRGAGSLARDRTERCSSDPERLLICDGSRLSRVVYEEDLASTTSALTGCGGGSRRRSSVSVPRVSGTRQHHEYDPSPQFLAGATRWW